MNEQTKVQVEAYAEAAPNSWNCCAHWEKCLRRPERRIFGQHSAGIGSGHKGQKMSASTALKM